MYHRKVNFMSKGLKEKIPDSVVIKPSGITGAGFGAFAVEPIKKGKRYEYIGKWLTPEEYDKKRSHKAYVWEIYKEYKKHGKTKLSDDVIGYIDSGNKRDSNWTRFVNCCRNKQEENMKHKQKHNRVYYVAKRDILPGEEILIWYGPGYGEQLGITTYDKKEKKNKKKETQ